MRTTKLSLKFVGIVPYVFLVADGKSLLSKCGVEKNMGLLQ